LEQRSEWIFKPKTDLYELLSGIRSLRPAAHDLTDEHKIRFTGGDRPSA
jgi:hypothetical protein